IDMQVLKIREYKTFGDMLANKEMSPYQREMANSLLDSMYGQLIDGISAERGLAADAVRAAIDAGPATPDELRNAGLVDDAQYLDELGTSLIGANGKFLSGDDYADRRQPLPTQVPVRHRLAVIYGVGPVTTGESHTSPLDGETNMGSDTLLE